MHARPTAASALVGIALLVGLAACGSDDPGATKATTTTTSAGTVTVDVDSDEPSVEFSDGEGNSMEIGEAASLPDGWPDDLAPPNTITVVSSSISSTGGEKQLFVTGESTAAFDDLRAGIKTQLESAGFEITQDISTPSPEGGFAGVEATSDAFDASVSIAEDSDAGKVTVLYTLTPQD